MRKNEFVEETILKLREYGKDFSQAMEDEVKQALARAWELGYSEGQNDKVKEVDEFYGGR